ncbi:unnamed protein product [Protopolystoma xenopodis]|uniref:Uncharacterized protein n=1 Tax=Protopolystoma xenopodis TaxID=117903 RepID=A0A448XFB2_9PLAT|nr:unnamed protein product [Protopolystoma xenopodis]
MRMEDIRKLVQLEAVGVVRRGPIRTTTAPRQPPHGLRWKQLTNPFHLPLKTNWKLLQRQSIKGFFGTQFFYVQIIWIFSNDYLISGVGEWGLSAGQEPCQRHLVPVVEMIQFQ